MSQDKARVRKQRSVSHAQIENVRAQGSDNGFNLFPSISIKEGEFCCNEGLQQLEHQVAGHQFINGQDTIGLLKCKDGTILKPCVKIDVGIREIRFYEQLQMTKDLMLIEFKEFTSNFYGTRMLDVNGKRIEFIILENITQGMLEPCVIDIKIGKQTWDPLASPEKIEKEKTKYTICKNDVSFCLPGFQVYKLSTGRVHRYNKEYGKKLNGQTVIDALRIFLNGEGAYGINRELLTQFLTVLWKIQKWAKKQDKIKLYSTSLLMVYDCKVLKTMHKHQDISKTSPIRNPIQRKISFTSPDGHAATSNFSGQISTSGPIFGFSSTPTVPLHHHETSNLSKNCQTTWQRSFHKIRSHSLNSNYKEYLSKIKRDYASTLEELNSEEVNPNNPWCRVKIIDFAHVFPTDEPIPDTNYLEGINSIVSILEVFLNSSS